MLTHPAQNLGDPKAPSVTRWEGTRCYCPGCGVAGYIIDPDFTLILWKDEDGAALPCGGCRDSHLA